MQGWSYPKGSFNTYLRSTNTNGVSRVGYRLHANRYRRLQVLLIGDISSKYVEAIPMRDQTAPTIIQNMWKHWLCRYGYPKYILTDRGSNVDGEVVNTLCSQFEKRRTSGYHSQGNGFTERNIRSIREILRTSLLEFKLPQILWRDILPSVVFALNSNESAATKCTPFTVVYGRKSSLSLDILTGTIPDSVSASTPQEYVKDLKIQIKDILNRVY